MHEYVVKSMQENRFAMCDICVKMKLERKECVNKAQQKILRTKLQEHLQRVRRVRKLHGSCVHTCIMDFSIL